MSSQVTALIVGAGKLGFEVVKNLANCRNVKVKALVRNLSPADDKKKIALQELQSYGAELLEGDITNRPLLYEVTKGVDVILCTVIGQDDVTFGGQKSLIDASIANNVTLYIPCDFSMNTENIEKEDCVTLYPKKLIQDYVKEKAIKSISFNTGLWFEYYDVPYSPFINAQTGKYEYAGDKDAPMQSISQQDTAKFVAAVISKPEHWQSLPSILNITSEKDFSISKIEKYLQEERNPNFQFVRVGSLEEAKQRYQQALQNSSTNFEEWFRNNQMAFRYSYMSLINSKKVLVDKYQNDLFPQIKVRTFKEYLQDNPKKCNV